MIKRAWMVLAAVWAIALTPMMFSDEHIPGANWLVVFAPLAIPTLAGWFWRYVTTGTPRRPRGARVMPRP